MRGLLHAWILALVLVPAAAAAGPWLGTLDGGGGISLPGAQVAYVTHVAQGATTVDAVRNGRVTASASLPGRWGIPYVTLNGRVGGLSANGKTLVLADRFEPTGELRAGSAFTVIDTRRLTARTIELRGDFGFDALSADGRTLYLIQHVSAENLLRYRVRAYDLRADRLLPRVIADKRQAGWNMTGYPIARASSADGRWVYTLYSSGDNYPFVHALDTKARTAVCIGIPWDWTSAGDGGIGPRFGIDTRTFKVSNG
jgi:hypothetical protein